MVCFSWSIFYQNTGCKIAIRHVVFGCNSKEVIAQQSCSLTVWSSRYIIFDKKSLPIVAYLSMWILLA